MLIFLMVIAKPRVCCDSVQNLADIYNPYEKCHAQGQKSETKKEERYFHLKDRMIRVPITKRVKQKS